MTVADHDEPETIAWQGNWITAKKRGRWEYVERARGIGAAVILPLDGEDVVLIEQYRVPVGGRVLELPAGLIGDDDSAGDDDPMGTAKRELIEETGYAAEEWRDLGYFKSSPGMSAEGFTLLRARGLTKIAEGGGLENEDIVVHRIALADLPDRIARFRADGVEIDVRILAVLGPWIMQ